VIAGAHNASVEKGSGRREMAEWLADPRNPLTARVMVNRIWQFHFGEGLVSTPNNFGKLGAAPSHPDLLDWPRRNSSIAAGALRRCIGSFSTRAHIE
jgi:hypothetical protein